MKRAPTLLALCAVLALAAAHSQMTQPQSTSPRTCRLGGERAFGVDNCSGPCDLRAIRARHRYANFWSPAHPAATYARGQNVLIKYTRNNHAPGGFIRLTLVTPAQMMDRDAHSRNAFHYSCWGARAMRAAPHELRNDRFGFSMVGSDGEQHRFAKGYYAASVTIPTVLPDGNYVLGWAWYGGTGGALRSANAPQYPSSQAYFGDYYSCAFVRVRGGPRTRSYRARFVNDMSQFSRVGCMASADRPGPCAREPCYQRALFRAPAPFGDGRVPPALTAANFGGGGGARATAATTATTTATTTTTGGTAAAEAACACLAARRNCAPWHARASAWRCRARVDNGAQSRACKMLCCSMCYRRKRQWRVCWHGNVTRVCGVRR
eukprot:TRINITY_DN9328_c0_g1_i1.p2 TRINITY_DN9328_c0_g1~~TRINITY_DN9328_c0_g1_i1.p2  ORF type:complete len:378 (+),score=73.94 TRINITY_DN9328_c0_g1_i1:957-2090(+)